MHGMQSLSLSQIVGPIIYTRIAKRLSKYPNKDHEKRLRTIKRPRVSGRYSGQCVHYKAAWYNEAIFALGILTPAMLNHIDTTIDLIVLIN